MAGAKSPCVILQRANWDNSKPRRQNGPQLISDPLVSPYWAIRPDFGAGLIS